MVFKFIALLSLVQLVLSLPDPGLDPEPIVGSNRMDEKEDDAIMIKREMEEKNQGSACKIHFSCEIAGGHCVTNDYDCRYGRLIPSACRGKGCKCCIPGCPEDQGFFRTPHPFNQCFKLIDKPSNWSDASKTCLDEGLVLARPLETVNLRNYLIMRYGDFSNSPVGGGVHQVTAWLDAVTDGTCMRWNRGPYKCISPKLPIWWPGNPGVAAVGNCLLLTSNAWDWEVQPQATFYSLPCDWLGRYPLCELLM